MQGIDRAQKDKRFARNAIVDYYAADIKYVLRLIYTVS
jgi:hypothetical protein